MDKKIKNSLELLSFEKILPESVSFPMVENFDLNGIYSVGVTSQSKYITIVSQQRRAIALARSLNNIAKNKKIENLKIVIIGGGFAGTSLAISLMNLNKEEKKFRYEIRLLESSNSVCHLQKNCHIRRLHPNVHNWPLKNWDNKKTSHPFKELDWQAETASIVASKITGTLYQILEDREVRNERGSLSVYTNCNDALISLNMNKYTVTVSGEENFGKLKENIKGVYSLNNIDLIFIASGFGTEKKIRNNSLINSEIKTNSYWRNESFAQSNLNNKDSRYLISGNGDGGLVDLFRILIDGYSQDDMLESLIPSKIEAYKNFKYHPLFNYPIEKHQRIKSLRTSIERISTEQKIINLATKKKLSASQKKKYLAKIDKLDEELDINSKTIDELKSSMDNYNEKVSNFKNQYNEFIKKLCEFKKNETTESEKLFEWLEFFFSKDENGEILDFIRGLITPKLLLNNKVVFFVKTKNKNKNKIEDVIENPNITFYNRILFYFAWCFTDFEIIKSNNYSASEKDEELIEIIYKYNIPLENIIIRHGSSGKKPILNIFSDSGLTVDLDEILKAKSNLNSEIITDYRFDKINYLKKL